jgi:hypothetical protein
MNDGIDWGVGGVDYGTAAPQGINWSPLTNALKQRQQGQQRQPGQPLNISPAGPGGPSYMDRLRDFLSGTVSRPTGPNPNPPVPTDIGEGPSPGYGGVDDFASRFY